MEEKVEAGFLHFAIIGAPKCGTGSLYAALQSLPNVVGSTPKEPFYFLEQDHPQVGMHGASVWTHGSTGYRTFFGDETRGTLRFEATTHSLYSDGARTFLGNAMTRPRFVVALRRPEDRVLSLLRFMQGNQASIDATVPVERLVDALLDGDTTTLTRAVITPTSERSLLRALDMSDYATFIAPWLEAYGRDAIHVVWFEELTMDPRRVLGHLATWLGLDASRLDPRPAKTNKSYATRFQTVHRAARRLTKSIPSLRQSALLRTLYERMQIVSPTTGGPESKEARHRLQTFFAPSVERLEDLLEVDLAAWKEVS